MKIDLHTHILPPHWPDLDAKYGYPGFVRLVHHKPCCARMMIEGKSFREITQNCWDPRLRIEECDQTGVDMQVLSTIPVLFSYWARPADALDFSRLLNDHISELVRDNPSRFEGLGTIPLQDPDLACRELERCVKELDLAGVQIGTHVEPNRFTGREQGWNLDEPALLPVFQTAEKLGAAVFIHPWSMIGRERMQKYWLPWLVGMPAETALAICCMIFGGVFEKCPKLRVAFAHGGGSFPGIIGRVEHGFNVRPDLVATHNTVNPRDYLARPDCNGSILPARFYVDSLVHDKAILRHLIQLMSPQRIILGSDYPFPLGEHRPGSLIESLAEISAEAKAHMFANNAAEFLGLSRSK